MWQQHLQVSTEDYGVNAVFFLFVMSNQRVKGFFLRQVASALKRGHHKQGAATRKRLETKTLGGGSEGGHGGITLMDCTYF